MGATRDLEFDAYSAQALVPLRRLAYLIGGNWQDADDAVQDALIKLYLRWSKMNGSDKLDAYVRRMVINAVIDGKRRPWRREHSSDSLPDAPTAGSDLGDSLTVRSALAHVPPGQRAVLVLRFYEGCDVNETARILGCSAGNIKSQTARGLARLHTLPDPVTTTQETSCR